MARRPDTPCADCGKLLWSSTSSLPAGQQRVCHDCRRQRRAAMPARPQRIVRERPTVPCEVCGEHFRQRSHGNGSIQRTCSRACGLKLKRRTGSILETGLRGQASTVPWATCGSCGTPFVKRSAAKRCAACRRSHPHMSAYVPATTCEKECAECGERFTANRRQRFCSKDCSNRAQNRDQRHRERALGKRCKGNRAQQRQRRDHRKQDQRIGPPFTLHQIAVRDGWRCHLCKKRVKREDASLDHLIPLVDGGSHSRSNVALAHHVCNARRSDRGAAQLLLIG